MLIVELGTILLVKMPVENILMAFRRYLQCLRGPILHHTTIMLILQKHIPQSWSAWLSKI